MPVGESCSEDTPCLRINNSTPPTEAYIPFDNRWETYVVPIIFAMIFLVGILGNGILILIFMRHRNMRNVPNMYIISLALGDLLLILFSVPFMGTVYTFDSWPYGETICKVSDTTKDISVGVSVFTLTALSAELFYCAISNRIHQSTSSKSFTFVILIAVWLLAGLLAVPSAFFSNLETTRLVDGHEIEYCFPYPEEFGEKYRKGVVLFKFLAYYGLPLCIISCFYILMAKHLEMIMKNMPDEMQEQSSQIRSLKKVAKMVLSLVIVFMICFLPHHVFMLWFHFHPSSQEDFDEFWNTLRIIAFCLSFIYSCINPIALYYISSEFRKYFNRYLFICSKTSSSNSDNIPTSANSPASRTHNSMLTDQIISTNADSTPLNG